MEIEWDYKALMAKNTLEFLKNFVVIHCADEESYQKQINYPGLSVHKEIHKQIKCEMCKMEKRFNDEGYNKDLVQEFASMVLAELLKHVGEYDREIAHFAREYSA